MRKKKETPSVLDMLDDLGLDNTEHGEDAVDLTRDIIEEGSDVDEIDNIENDPADVEDDKKAVDDEEEEIPQEILDKMNKKDPPISEGLGEDEQDTEEVTDEEVLGVGMFFDAFAEALNWDVEEEDKPKSINDLIDYIGDMVEQNSTPQYADERVALLDNYIKNGGRFEDFYNGMSQRVSYDSIDMEDESNLKAVVRDYMKLQGFSDEQINRRIERFEDADMLEEEATDAVEMLKNIQEQQLQQVAAQQERERIAQEERARQFMTDLNSSIASLDNIRGIAVPKEDRKRLLDYITRTDADGLTQYQKDFNSNMVNNLIESAYFTMKGDSLLGEAKRNGQTSASSKLRTMLKHQTKNHSTFSMQDEKQVSALDVASKIFR